MHCSVCGKSINENLNYCNGCGAPTENSSFLPDRRAGRLFIVSGTFIVVIGLMAFYPIMRTLIMSPIDTAAKLILILSYLLTVLAMFATTMALGWKQINAFGRSQNSADTRDEYRAPASFRDVNTSRLPAGDPGLGSVIDSTTRTLEEVPILRK